MNFDNIFEVFLGRRLVGLYIESNKGVVVNLMVVLRYWFLFENKFIKGYLLI